MRVKNKKSEIFLSIIIVISLALSVFFMFQKQGFHEDELLTYNLANSSKQLATDGWNTAEDFNDYLSVSENQRFNYAQVYENQIKDASHPPFYYALVHTVCSFFPNLFSKWLAFSINVLAMTGILILLYKIAKRVSGNEIYALIGTGAYAFSLACITTTIYLRMYSTLTFFVLSFVYLSLKLYDKKNTVRVRDCIPLGITVFFGILTQYYFILYAGLTGLVFLIFKIKEKCGRDLFKYIITCVIAATLALCAYPFIIANVLGGNRGLGSLDFSSIDFITIVTYVIYKLFTYVQILAKDLFLNQIWLLAMCAGALAGIGVYFRFTKKKKLSRKAILTVLPAIVFFLGISLVSPFNSDRYIMASLPVISLTFTFGFIKLFELVKNKKLRLILPASIVLASAIGFLTVTPYYVYGKTNLYKPQTDNCVFVGTAMLEWNKCIDKFMQYDNTMIVTASELSRTLGDELETLATDRGIITNGKISELAKAFMNNGGQEKEELDTLSALKNDEKLNSLDEITVYISRLANREDIIKYITDNTSFKSYELTQEDYSFNDFYNWYDYFVETESYCNVYRFYK